MDEFQRKLIERLLTRGAIRLDDPTSQSGVSINLQRPPRGLLTEGDADMVDAELNCMVMERAELQFFDLVAGIPGSGEPFAKAVAYISGKPLLTIGEKVEGEHSLGQRLLLVSPQIAREVNGEKEAIGIAEGAGLRVAGIATLIDLQQGGRKKLQRAGCYIMVVFTLEAILEHCVRTGRISGTKREEMIAALTANR